MMRVRWSSSTGDPLYGAAFSVLVGLAGIALLAWSFSGTSSSATFFSTARDASCHDANDAQVIDTSRIDEAPASLAANPRSCVLGDPSACGDHGECTAVSAVLESTRWSRSDSSRGCFWLEYAAAEASAATLGLCVCEGHFDLDGCARCEVGWTGDTCEERVIWERRSIANLSVGDRDAFKDYYLNGTFVASSPLLAWVHGTSQAQSYLAGACPGVPRDPHESAWLLHWHRLYIAAGESTMQSHGIGTLHWDLLSDSDAADVLYTLHPELEMGGACPRLALPEVAQPADIAWMLQRPTFDAFFADFFELHMQVHEWFCLTGVVADGCPGVKTAACDALAPFLPLFENQEETPLFWAFHTETDRLFELWMMAHGYENACRDSIAAAVEQFFPDQQLAEPALGSCLTQMAVGKFDTSSADMCSPTTSFGYRYVGMHDVLLDDNDGDEEEIHQRIRSSRRLVTLATLMLAVVGALLYVARWYQRHSGVLAGAKMHGVTVAKDEVVVPYDMAPNDAHIRAEQQQKDGALHPVDHVGL